MNPSPYKALWASALLLAIRDVRSYLKKHKTVVIPDGMDVSGDAGDSIRWVMSESPRPGGFLWVCSVLEHDPIWVRDKIRMPRMADKNVLNNLDDFLEDE